MKESKILKTTTVKILLKFNLFLTIPSQRSPSRVRPLETT
ncbi:MAG: Unknown protein [uncultured Sulfurovum sp.]|uniref:Uncharacterized protein n=1 Tax=uncultured Sulfurovum sp. TaxID=269237 RepID=A0A6S6U0K0_9BACT|nr:MAG: Unknown protein [uncultured Sulfurovum sp.]